MRHKGYWRIAIGQASEACYDPHLQLLRYRNGCFQFPFDLKSKVGWKFRDEPPGWWFTSSNIEEGGGDPQKT